jgi:GNAT superfamily N-acetyltransferase
MDYQIKDFSTHDIPDAVELFLQNYKRETKYCTQLPEHIILDPKLITSSLNSTTQNPGVAAFSNNQMISYLVTGSMFSYKNQNAAMIPEYGHSAIHEDTDELYKLMYMRLSDKWIHQNIHLHIIGHFAHDEILTDTLFQLGFGAIVSEKLRDLSPVVSDQNIDIQVEKNPLTISELEQELRYYARSTPIFIIKNIDLEAIVSDLTDQVKIGDAFLVSYANDVPVGYFCIGPSTQNGEGFLLQDTNTAQVKSAVITSFFRRRGIGSALLNEAVTWARVNGFDRLFVEHETANYSGSKFWEKYFTSYLYFSIRYINNTI